MFSLPTSPLSSRHTHTVLLFPYWNIRSPFHCLLGSDILTSFRTQSTLDILPTVLYIVMIYSVCLLPISLNLPIGRV